MDDPLIAFPIEFVRRLKQLIPPEKLPGIISGLTHDRKTTLRTNTLKTDDATLVQLLHAHGVKVQSVDGIPHAYIVDNTPLRTITELSEYTEGKLYVQSLSSMIPPLVLDPKPGEKVLDLSAAPGSKTTQMAALMHNQGEIVANDTSQTRLYRLYANLNLQGVTIAKTTKMDGRSFWKNYPEYFDKTLVDVPCSMDGRFNVNQPKTFEDWSLKKVRDLSMLQRWLLRSAISATKPHGIIVYSTCTLSPEENENVVNWVVEKDKHAVVVESIQTGALPLEPAITTWGSEHFSGEISNTARIYPSSTMEGFFIAKLRKVRSSVPTIVSSFEVREQKRKHKARSGHSRHH